MPFFLHSTVTFDLLSTGANVSRHWLTSRFPWNGRCWSPFCRESRGSLTWVGYEARGPESWWKLPWQWRPPHRAPWPRCCSPIRHTTPRWALEGRDRGRSEREVTFPYTKTRRVEKKTGAEMEGRVTETGSTEEAEAGINSGKWNEKTAGGKTFTNAEEAWKLQNRGRESHITCNIVTPSKKWKHLKSKCDIWILKKKQFFTDPPLLSLPKSSSDPCTETWIPRLPSSLWVYLKTWTLRKVVWGVLDLSYQDSSDIWCRKMVANWNTVYIIRYLYRYLSIYLCINTHLSIYWENIIHWTLNCVFVCKNNSEMNT